MRFMDQREREDWDEHCHEHDHHWAFHIRSPWTHVSKCVNCWAVKVEDIEHEEER